MAPGEPDLDGLLQALRAARRGDLTVRLPGDGELAREWNGLLDEVGAVVAGVTEIAGELAGKGTYGGQVVVTHAPRGAWKELVDGVNQLLATMTDQFRGIAGVTRAVARGDLSRRVTVQARGEVLELADTINAMIERLQAFRAEVARVSRQLESEGAPAGLVAARPDLGVWQELVDNVSLAEQIAAASRSRSEFLANMSHELRTPLNSLLILARLLADNPEGGLTTRQVEYARTISGAGNDLLTLINEILDLSKLEAGKMRVDAREVDLVEVEALIERDFRPVAEHKRLAFTMVRDPDAPPVLRTDPQRLHQVLRNLISNAFKFTERGGVTVRIAAAGDQQLGFSVTDTGIGIDPAKHERIFEAFQQADGSTSRRFGGTGLGLSISRGFARLLGGELRVVSGLGAGSTFTLTIPRCLAAGPDGAGDQVGPPRSEWMAPALAPAVIAPAAALAGRRALVVDDDVRNIFALAALLEAQQMQLRYAEGGQQALDVLALDPHIDVVLIDIMMPDLDGHEVMRRLRADPRHRELPIIAVTARAFPEDRQRCLDAGASEYLPKPIDPQRLVALMAQAMRR